MRYANATASSAPARTTTSHSPGATSWPNSENTVVNSTGSGFHDEPDIVSRSRCATSRPQMIHDHGSLPGGDGSISDSAASATQPSTSSGSAGAARSRATGALPAGRRVVGAGRSARSEDMVNRPAP